MNSAKQKQRGGYTQTATVGTESIAPRVLTCSLFSKGSEYPGGFRLEERYVYDYEIEYMLTGGGAMVVEDKEYPIMPGEIVFRRPGQFAQGIMPYTCYLICFDLLGNTGKIPGEYDIGTKQPFQTNYTNPLLDVIPPVCRLPNSQKYLRLFEKAFDEYLTMNEASPLILRASVLELLHGIYQDITRPPGLVDIPSNQYYPVIKKTVDFISAHYNEKVKLEALAASVNLSIGHFQKIFVKSMKMSPNEYLTRYRLEKSKELLAKSDLKIAEIAQRCGFESSPYFDYVFKKSIKLTPMEFKNRLSYP